MFNKEYIKFEILYKKCNEYICKKFGNKYNGEYYFSLRKNGEIENYTYLPINYLPINIFLKKTVYKYIKDNIVHNKTLLDKIFSYINSDNNYYVAFGFDKKNGRIKLYIENFDSIFLIFLYSQLGVSKEVLNEQTETIGFDFYLYENKFDIKFYNKIPNNTPPELLPFKNEIFIGSLYHVFSLNGRFKMDCAVNPMPNASEMAKKLLGIDYNIQNVHLSHIGIENGKIYSLYFMKNK